ncbi:type IV pilus modification protein PilV [Pseudohongiella acticola]|uniref:Type IV pilus modification protein PilV n=1 Tax=Pseudohongiella acticola TaxID=1524254 RepID=A0A1E8CEX7_9GAMM|nr:type IV pilus modification protein PilV [Pseudohongiella acticola]OFE11031.1 type IV pilus modification protein PilV [Pseudohongiella acticola]
MRFPIRCSAQTRNIGSHHVLGIALFEVLLTSFILAAGILAVLNMQAMAVATSQNNSHQQRAEWLLHDMLERMKANPQGFWHALQVSPDGEPNAQCLTMTGCSPAELAAHDLANWQQQLVETLPVGSGEIKSTTLAGYPHTARAYRVSVHWQGSQGSGSATQRPDSSAIVVL